MMNLGKTDLLKTKRTYKSRMFEMIFSDKKELLGLYNAVNGTHYEDPEILEVNTLENAIYMSMKNDISFIIDLRLNLYEHQSSENPNLPLRYLLYIGDVYSAFTKDENIYGQKIIEIPTPRFVIFYNGRADQPDIQELRLSDAFSIPEKEPSLELKAIMLNINRGRNAELMDACKTLKDYAEYTARVREYAEEVSLDIAVERAITECIQEGILADFLRKNRTEAKKVSIYEYDEERCMRMMRKAAIEEGLEEGLAQGLAQGLERGLEQGLEQGLEKGMREGEIKNTINMSQEFSLSKEVLKARLKEKFGLIESEVEGYMKKYWKE